MERNQFTFYRSFFESAKDLSKNQSYELIMAICEYALNGNEVELKGSAKAVFRSIKPTLESSARKAKSGKAGANAKQTVSKPEANDKQTVSKPLANAKQTVSEKEKENKKESEREKKREKEKEKEIEDYSLSLPLPPLPGDGETVLPFDTFWEHYPRKLARLDAIRAFAKVGEADRLKILPALEKAKRTSEWTRDGGRFIPYPASWLNGRRWEDEGTEARLSGQAEADAMFDMLADWAREGDKNDAG